MVDETNTDSPKQLLNTLTCPKGHTGEWTYWDVIPRSRQVWIAEDGTVLLGDDNSNFTVHGRDGYFSCEFEGCRYTVSADDVEYEEVSSFGL
jgi:hypothetical protein